MSARLLCKKSLLRLVGCVGLPILRDLGCQTFLQMKTDFPGSQETPAVDDNHGSSPAEHAAWKRIVHTFQQLPGNIGFHHIHHLSPHIPNYNLEDCHKADPLFQRVPPITLATSLKSLNFHLWDEKSRKLVGFSHLKQMRREQQPVAA